MLAPKDLMTPEEKEIKKLQAENKRLTQAAQQARSAIRRHANLPWGQPGYPVPTPGAELLYEAASYLDGALKPGNAKVSGPDGAAG